MNIAGFTRLTKLSFSHKQLEHDDIYSFFFKPDKPIKHIAGQHGPLILPGFKGVHIFSLSSAPEEEFVRITTHVRAGSNYKQKLAGLQPGDTLRLAGPVLDFVVKHDETDDVFLAQGIGITPFRSMLVHAKLADIQIKTRLVHVSETAHTFQSETTELASEAFFPTDRKGFNQHVGDLAFDKNTTFYLSGTPKFIASTKQTLKARGITNSQFKTDSFGAIKTAADTDCF